MFALRLFCVHCSGCGAGGDTGGGDDNLPNRGFAPYTFAEDSRDSNEALFPKETAELRHPMALVQEQSFDCI